MGHSSPASESHNNTPPLATSVRWRILAVLLAYSFMSWFNRMTMTIAYNEHIHKELAIPLPVSSASTVGLLGSPFGQGPFLAASTLIAGSTPAIDEETMGSVYSALILAYAICMIPGGWLADRFGPWKALVVMGFGSALFQAATGVVGWLSLPALGLVTAWLIVRALMGVFTAPIYPSSGRMVAHWFPPHQRALANGLVTGAALLGIASTFEGFGGLMDWLGWPAAFVVVGAITASAALVWTLYATDRPAEHRGVNNEERQWIQGNPLAIAAPEGEKPLVPGGWWRLLGNRSLILLTISYAAVGYFEYLMYFWAQYYFTDILKLTKEDSRTYSTLLNLAMAAGIMLGGWISDRLVRSFGYRRGRMLVPVCGMTAGAALLYLGAQLRLPLAVLACFSLAVAAVGASEGPFWTIAIDLGGFRGATSAAICNTGGNLGGAIAPRVTPWIGRVFGWQAAIAAGSVVCLAGVVLWLWIDPQERAENA